MPCISVHTSRRPQRGQHSLENCAGFPVKFHRIQQACRKGKLRRDVLLLRVTWSNLLSKFIISLYDKKPSRYREVGNTSVVMMVFRWCYVFSALAVSFRLAWRTALSYGKKLLCNYRQRKMKKKPSSDLNGRLKLSDMVSAGSLLKYSLIFFFWFCISYVHTVSN